MEKALTEPSKYVYTWFQTTSGSSPCENTVVSFSSAAIHRTRAPATNLSQSKSISDGHAQHHLKHHRVPKPIGTTLSHCYRVLAQENEQEEAAQREDAKDKGGDFVLARAVHAKPAAS